MIWLWSLLAVYFWMGALCHRIYINRLKHSPYYGDEVDAWWAAIFWPVTVLIWTAKALGDCVNG